MIMSAETLQSKEEWSAKGVALPLYDVSAMAAKTKACPTWLHFGAGNIFRGFIASLQQTLLNAGLADKGIVVAETFDYEIIDKVYRTGDNLTMNVILNQNATTSLEIIASVAQAIKASPEDAAEMAELARIIENPALQMISFTITEKGYAINGADGTLLPLAQADMNQAPENARHAMGILTALLLRRYKAGKYPVAVVSMDNCSHNGEKIHNSVMQIARSWVNAGYAQDDFLAYLNDEAMVSFPWSMIDKITPRPDAQVQKILADLGIEGMEPVLTCKNTYIAPFVNAERPQCLVIEDQFPNGHPPLEKAGIYFASRDVVNKVERMKVTTCLNPLHTAMSIYGCLLGYVRISAEMEDADIVALINRLGYLEGLPVVTDPGILSPKAFIDEVVNERLPNPFMPDDPRRIVTDTSQKVGIRFGETIKSYIEQNRDLNELVALPLAIAGWFRYLLAVGDDGKVMAVSSDPMLQELQARLAGISWNDPASYKGQLREIMANSALFGLDLTQTSLCGRIEQLFMELLAGQSAVRKTLHKHMHS